MYANVVFKALDVTSDVEKEALARILGKEVGIETEAARAIFAHPGSIIKGPIATTGAEHLARKLESMNIAVEIVPAEREAQKLPAQPIAQATAAVESSAPAATPAGSGIIVTFSPDRETGGAPPVPVHRVDGPLRQPLYTMRGVGELLEVYEDRLTLTPKGFMGLLSKGLRGPKELSFDSITAIQIKQPGFTSGYLQFTTVVGPESKAGTSAATTDEHTFMFADNDDLAELIKLYIESQIRKTRQPLPAAPSIMADEVTQPVAPASLADELKKLAELKSMGVLSEDEFQRAKQKLLE